MMTFSSLMDDLKSALILSKEHKGLYLPALLVNILFILVGIIFVVFVLISVAGTAIASMNNGYKWQLILGYGIALLIFSLFVGVLFLALDIGISGMVIALVDGEKPTSRVFFTSIKRNIIQIFFTKVGLFFISIFALIVLILPLLIYLLTVGILTAGWGMIFLSCSVQAFFGMWTLILIEDQRGGFDSIGANIVFARKNFWPLILVFYINLSLSSYLPSLLGLIGASFAALFVSYMMLTYTKLVLLMSYRRYKAS